MQCERNQCALNQIECALPRSGFKPVRMRFDFLCSVNAPLAWPPHAYKGPCLFGRPARIHSRMRVQLMASARHAIDSRDASLLPMPYGHVPAYNHMTWRPSRPYYLWFYVELLYCWCCCGLFYDYVERTEH